MPFLIVKKHFLCRNPRNLRYSTNFELKIFGYGTSIDGIPIISTLQFSACKLIKQLNCAKMFFCQKHKTERGEIVNFVNRKIRNISPRKYTTGKENVSTARTHNNTL